MKPPKNPSRSRRTTALVLGGVFLIALLMGAGPGLLLVNPVPGAEPKLIASMPAVYAWTLIWFLVEATIVVIAACKLWQEEDS